MPDPITTTLFRPVLIETAEQAEQLPIGTVATFPGQALAAVRSDYDTGGWLITTDCDPNVSHEDMIGATALVPATATIETTWKRGLLTDDGSLVQTINRPQDPIHVTRRITYDTPWTPEEEA